jgi:hypothetical protein
MFEDLSLYSRAMNLAYFELLGDANMINTEISAYRELTLEMLQNAMNSILIKEKCSLLIINPLNHV